MTKRLWTAALVAAIGLAAPTVGRSAAGDDAKDTATEQGYNAKKKARDLKPGDKTAEDRKDDAKDTGKAMKAKTKKKSRQAANKTKDAAHDTKDAVNDAVK